MYPPKLTPTYRLIEKEQHQPTKRLKLPNMYIYTYIYKYIYMHHIYIIMNNYMKSYKNINLSTSPKNRHLFACIKCDMPEWL